MYSTILSQRISLLSAPTLNPINCSGDWRDAAASPHDRASARARRRPSNPVTSRRVTRGAGAGGRVGGTGAPGAVDDQLAMSKNRPAFPSETTMQKTLGSLTRMDAIQAPIVAVIGDLIRQVPGTISLGQGVVHYGPR